MMKLVTILVQYSVAFAAPCVQGGNESCGVDSNELHVQEVTEGEGVHLLQKRRGNGTQAALDLGQAPCFNSDGGALDSWDLDCEAYDHMTSFCGNHEDDDFSSDQMCCACGGGVSQAVTTPAPTPDPTQACPSGFDRSHTGYWAGYVEESGDDGDIDDCANICVGDASCVAINFNSGDNKCFSYTTLGEPVPNKDSVACIKQANGNGRPLQATDYNLLYGCDTRLGNNCSDGSYCGSTTAQSTWLECAALCSNDASCAMFAYRHDSGSWCRKCVSNDMIVPHPNWGVYQKAAPTPASTLSPTPAPTMEPTAAPTPAPTLSPTPAPTLEPAPAQTPSPTPEWGSKGVVSKNGKYVCHKKCDVCGGTGCRKRSSKSRKCCLTDISRDCNNHADKGCKIPQIATPTL